MATNDANPNVSTPLEAPENSSLSAPMTSSPAFESKNESSPLPENQLEVQQMRQPQPLQRQHEYTRRYIQWKEDDIALLLDDLEKPGHYESWKTNKSGYGKRVAEEVFRDILYQDGIKFKVRWLENRIRKYDQVLTIEANKGGEPARLKLLEKIQKEFPFYFRVKRIIESASSSSPCSSSAEQQQQKDTNNSSATTALPQFPRSASPSSSSSSTVQSHDLPKTLKPSSSCAMEKEETINTTSPQQGESSSMAWQVIRPDVTPSPATGAAASATASTSAPTLATYTNNNLRHVIPVSSSKRRKVVHRVSDELTRDRQLRVMELDLESKKMDHDERMQQMRLEQLRLEIELEKIRSGRHNG